VIARGVVLLVAATSAIGCTDSGATAPAPGPAPIVVELTNVATEEMRDVVDLVGQLEAEESVLIKPETRGVIATVDFVEGQEVAAGTLLFRLRDEEQQARLHEADANLLLANEQYDRAKTLAAQRSVSQDELDRAVASRDAAKARRELARVALDRTMIRAPFDGALGARLVSPGDRVDTNTGLVNIEALARLRLLFSLPEVAVPLARIGMPLELTVAARPGDRFAGEVYFVAPALDAANRRLLLKALVPNPERKLRPGMFATIRVEVARHPDALVIPETALAYDAGGAYVWRLNGDHTAERAHVTVGLRSAARVEITAGLRAGDRIVAAGTHKVTAGAPLQQAAAAPGAQP
jgi:membrane fusion protein (multidrug efflux system)